MEAGEWQATGLAEGLTWISMGGPAMQCRARCGHVLNVNAAYLLNSQSCISTLFAGLQEKRSFCLGEKSADRLWQLQKASWLSDLTQPPVIERMRHAGSSVSGVVPFDSRGFDVTHWVEYSWTAHHRRLTYREKDKKPCRSNATAPTDDVTYRSKSSNWIAATKTQIQQNSLIKQSSQSLTGCAVEPVKCKQKAFFSPQSPQQNWSPPGMIEPLPDRLFLLHRSHHFNFNRNQKKGSMLQSRNYCSNRWRHISKKIKQRNSSN